MSRQGSWPRGLFKWITVHSHDSLAAGYTQMQNLEGSIFQWANERRPLLRDGEPMARNGFGDVCSNQTYAGRSTRIRLSGGGVLGRASQVSV